EVRLRGRGDLGRQVAEVVVVGNLLADDRRGPSGPELVHMLDADEIAIDAGDSIVRQEFAVDLARELPLEVAELAAELQAALGEPFRRERRVAVLGDVPVVRQRDLEAALSGRPQ